MRAITVKGRGRSEAVFVIPDDAGEADIAAAVLFLAVTGGLDVTVVPAIEATSLADFHRAIAAFGWKAAAEVQGGSPVGGSSDESSPRLGSG